MKRIIRRRNERGQSLVELALTAPVFFLVIAGLIHFGMTMHTQQVITNASVVGARRAGQPEANTGAVQTAVMNYCQQAGLDTSKLGVDINMGSVNSNIQVTVSYQFSSPVENTLKAMMAMVTGTTQTSLQTNQLQATTVMRY
jgi:Flp pilus assembly protein TadG